MTKNKKRTLVVVLSAALILSGNILQGACQKYPVSAAAETDTGSEIAPATGVNVAYHTQEEIRDYVADNGATVSDALTFSQEPGVTAPYSLGKLSDETQSSAIAMLNQIRYIAGISDQVELSDEYEELVQAASLCNYVNNLMTHYPVQPSDMTDEMYALAQQGASHSNIAWASRQNRSLNETIVKSWMCDDSASNIETLGHRRWFLNPSMGKTGFGAVSGGYGTHSAVYAFDRSNSSAKEYGVMWPAQNMPVEYFGKTYPWSISMGYTVDASKVKVTLTRTGDGKEWVFSGTDQDDGYFNVNNGGYGQLGCIIFRPETDDLTGYNAGDTYQVTITGLSEDVSYTVRFFNLVEQQATPSPSPTVQPTASPTVQPSTNPSVQPSIDPSIQSSTSPSAQPSTSPSMQPSTSPSAQPSTSPSAQPSTDPSAQPSTSPSAQPSTSPSAKPTQNPEEQAKIQSSATPQAKVQKPAKVKILSLKSTGKKKLKVKWKKLSNQNGYQIQCATNRKFTKNKKTFRMSTKTSSKTIKGLKSKKTYFVRVRAFRTVSGGKSYGAWSSIKKCKVK